MRRKLAALFLACLPVFAVGTVQQSFQQLGQTTTFVLAVNWTGDSINGSVPATLANLGGLAIQGYRIFSVEVAPGSPAPSANYSLTLTTFLGTDALAGSGSSLSATLPTTLQAPSTAPPVNGVLTINIAGNSVASAQGRFLVYFAPIFQVMGLPSVNAAGNNTFSGTNVFTGPSTFSGTISSSGTNTLTGSNTFTGLLNCKNIEASIFCIDTANTQGWGGVDTGAQINSAIAAWPSTGGQLLIASGVYTVSTPIVGAQNGTFQCPTGPGTSGARAVLNFTPATGTMISWSNASFQLIGCDLKTTTSTTSVALQMSTVGYKTNIERDHINGFFGGIYITGNGSSTFSTGVQISNTLIDGINANCGGGAGYGINIDHARDITYDKNQIYSVSDCATGTPMILDTGVGGIWLSGSTFEQGLHAGVIRNTNQGGSYSTAPQTIIAHGITWDLSPGGDALLFDSTLGTTDIRFFCASCWGAGAGKNSAGTVITAGAVGFNVQGGTNIHFVGGTARGNASWGFLLGTSGSNISVEGTNVHANNQGNTATVGGIKIAGPTNWRVENVRSGNTVESGGNQAWGLDITGASNTGLLSGNDFRNNTSGRVNYPAGIAQAGVDAPEFGSGTGLHLYGPSMWLEQTAPAGVAGEEVCYGDSTAHNIKCNLNNTGFGPLVTAAPCTTSQRTESAADANLLTCAIPAQAGSYRVRFVLSLSAANAATLGWTITWTDAGGIAHNPVNVPIFAEANGPSALTFTTSTTTAFWGYQDVDVNNSGASIVVKLTFSGTSFTGKASATVERII